MLSKLFNEPILSLISVKTSAEYDTDFQNFLSYSFDDNTIIITDNYSLLDYKSKYKEIYNNIFSWEEIINKIDKFKNKKIFLDIYIGNIVKRDYSQTDQIYFYNKNKFHDIYNICVKNKLQIVFISQSYLNGSSNMIASSGVDNSIIQILDLYIHYENIDDDKEITIRKSRYHDSGLIFNLNYWKRNLRRIKFKRIIK